MTKRWNPKSNEWEPFSPGRRTYPALTSSQQSELKVIEPSLDGGVRYFPCRVRLRDNTWRDYVYIVESSEYIGLWGIWPDQDKSKREVKIEEVLEIQESHFRLPRQFAQKLYTAGESGMGGVYFALRYHDLTLSYHAAGNAIDFVNLPEGKTVRDIKGVTPHEGRSQKNQIPAPAYAWCLHSVK